SGPAARRWRRPRPARPPHRPPATHTTPAPLQALTYRYPGGAIATLAGDAYPSAGRAYSRPAAATDEDETTHRPPYPSAPYGTPAQKRQSAGSPSSPGASTSRAGGPPPPP